MLRWSQLSAHQRRRRRYANAFLWVFEPEAITAMSDFERVL
jgi:hypothetical protein